MARAAENGPRAERGAAREAQIRIEASRLFVERGYDRTSMQDIADAVGLTKPGLYHFFKSKEDLLSQILDAGIGRLERDVLAPAREVADPAERIATLIRLHVANISRLDTGGLGNPVTAVVENMVGLGDDRRTQMNARLRQVFDLVRGALDELKAAGRLTKGLDPTVAAFSVIGMVMWTNRWRKPGGRLSPDDTAESIVKLALQGVLSD